MPKKITKSLCQVLLPVPFDSGFSYFVPEDLMLEIGDVVRVSFRNKEMFGVVVSRESLVESGIDEKKIKTVIVKDERIKFSSQLLQFIDFVAGYNLIPKGLVLKLSLAILNSSKEPKRGKKAVEKLIKIDLKKLNESQQEAADLLLEKIAERKFSTILLDGITGSGKTEVYFQAIAKIIQSTTTLNHPPLEGGSKQLAASGRGPKALRFYSAQTLLRAQELRQNQTDAESLLWYYLKNKQLDSNKFRRQHPIAKYIVDFVCLESKLIIELGGGQHNEEDAIKYDSDRTQLLQNLGYKVLRFWNDEVFKNMDGVLGMIWNEFAKLRDCDPSPKQLAASTLPQGEGDLECEQNNNQILILLPEIALTSQLCKRFEQQFGFEPDLWHSKISPAKKRELFFKIANGSCRVLIGARSALFLPFKNLQLIVVDEEHDASFKQEDVVNYNGRDMAIMRAKIENIAIILSSATPSLESYLNAQNNKYQLIKLTQRFGQEEKTAVNLLDMRQEKLAKDHFISAALKNLLEDNLKNNRQSLLFLNRRGYAPLTLCKKCGQKVSCKNCSSYLTFHQKTNRLVCHHCGVSKSFMNPHRSATQELRKNSIPLNRGNICPSCNEVDCLVNCGVGVEKLQEEVLEYFPDARIGLMTSDNIKNNDDAGILIEQILEHKIDIIIGTQMIAKGHHFPSLALVGIIDGDGSFAGGNLRTLERSFQLLTQVIGRAGREHFAGQVLLQTYNPENSVFKNIIENKRDEFLEGEIAGRKAMGFPPFSKMATIIFSGIDENLVVDFAKFVLRKFPINKAIEVFGPAPMPITRVKNRYHYCLNIKVERKINLQKLIVDCLNLVKAPSSIRVKVDIDPI